MKGLTAGTYSFCLFLYNIDFIPRCYTALCFSVSEHRTLYLFVTLLPMRKFCLLQIILANQILLSDFFISPLQSSNSFFLSLTLINMLVDLMNQYCQFHFLSVWITTLPALSQLLKQDLLLRLLFRVFIPNLTHFSGIIFFPLCL